VAGTKRRLKCQPVTRKDTSIEERIDGTLATDYALQEDGSIKRVQTARSIAPVCHEFRTKRAVMPLVSEVLAEVNTNPLSPEVR
jgi:hypothetical protein